LSENGRGGVGKQAGVKDSDAGDEVLNQPASLPVTEPLLALVFYAILA